MTKEQIDELRYSLSPSRFAREVLNFTPDPWQEKMLESNSKRIILNCSRQAGKSTVTSVKANHKAQYFKNSLTLVISPSQRQSSELFKKIVHFHKRIPNRDKLIEDNKLSMSLRNGSRIVSLPASEDTVRGFSAVDLLIIDEASKVSDSLYRTLRPMLAVSNGELIVMSTPFGKRGFFFEEWSNGGDVWERHRTTAYDVPRITNQFLEEEKRSMGDWWFKQEYLCEFVETDDSVFGYDMVMNSLSGGVEPLNFTWDDEVNVQPLVFGV